MRSVRGTADQAEETQMLYLSGAMMPAAAIKPLRILAANVVSSS